MYLPLRRFRLSTNCSLPLVRLRNLHLVYECSSPLPVSWARNVELSGPGCGHMPLPKTSEVDLQFVYEPFVEDGRHEVREDAACTESIPATVGLEFTSNGSVFWMMCGVTVLKVA